MFLPSPPVGGRAYSAPIASIRILVADAHPVVRAGVKALVATEPDLQVIGEAADGAGALRLAAELSPDVVVLDVSLPGLDGARVTARLREAHPEQKVLVLTACEDSGSLRLLLDTGAHGYVLKHTSAEELVRAIRAVAAGGTFIDPTIAGNVVVPSAGDDERDVGLSERERDVVRFIALGYSNKEIAARLKVSVKTVETYKSRAMEKLQIRSRVELVRYAIKCGWLADTDGSSGAAAPLRVARFVSGQSATAPSESTAT